MTIDQTFIDFFTDHGHVADHGILADSRGPATRCCSRPRGCIR